MPESQLQCPEVNRLTAERKTLTQMLVTLPDQIRFKSRGLKVRVRMENGFLCLQPQGYGEPDAMNGDGSPVFLELYDGHLRVVVTSDINDEGSRTIIDLEEAQEWLRTPSEP